MKKIIVFCLLIIAFFSLASCQEKGGTIVFLTNRTDLKNTLLKQAQQEFAEAYSNKGYKVRVETITNYEDTVTTRISGRNYGDVLLIPQTIEPKDLGRYFISFGSKEELTQSGWKGINVKAFANEVYGLPIGLQASGIMINLSLFSKAGVDSSTLTTPELFLDAMKTIQAYGVANVTDFKAAFHTQTATGWGLTQWAGGITTVAGSKDYINYALPWDTNAFWNESLDEAGQIGKMYELLFSLIKEDVVEKSPTINSWEESKIWFAEGKIGAMALGSWAIEQFEAQAESIASGLSNDVGYMPYPFTNDEGDMVVSIASDYTIGVAKNSKKSAIANIFAKWLIDDFNYPAKTGNIPPKEGAEYPAKIESFRSSGALLVEDSPAPINLEGALSLAEKNAVSSLTDEKKIALWDPVWISDFVEVAFDVRDNKSSVTVKELLMGIQAKWNNGVNEVIKEYGPKPT